MDQQSGDTDKRNWRERLGIGKQAGASELPKLADDFKGNGNGNGTDVATAGRPPLPRAAAHAPIKAAPMAPRAPKAGSAPAAPARTTTTPAPSRTAIPAPASSTPRAAPVAPDALASKLRDQREAAERLAQQRIQAAKARAEANAPSPSAPANSGAKPKFTFADDSNGSTNGAAPRPTTPWATPQAGAPRPAAVTPPAAAPRPQFSPQVQPPRPQLGGAATPPPAYPSARPSYGQQYQPPYNSGYSNPYGQPPSGYRPIDPSSGYAPPPGYNPPGPRGNVPSPRLSPTPSRGTSYTSPPQLQIGPALDDSDGDDIFETAPQRSSGRRATANDYNQAYQDELDYDDQPRRSGSFGMILGLLLLGLLVAFAVVFGYSHFIKGQTGSIGTGGVPVVNAPATPNKSTPDANTSQQGDAANKKLIYDRIEGDHEVPGGPLKSTEQAPAAQQGGDTGGGATNGDASQPVPLPPPPGANNGQQGALSPDAKTNIADANTAAGQNPAANSSGGDTSTVSVTPAVAAPDAPVPGTAPPTIKPAAQDANIPAPPAATSDPSAADNGDEQIGNTKAKPAKTTPKATAPATDMAKAAADPTKGKSLGAAPVVLVPPAKTAGGAPVAAAVTPVVPAKQTSTAPIVASSGGGLYGDAPVTAAPQQLAAATPKAPAIAAPAPLAAPVPTAPKAGTGAYIVQLSSFGSQAEASAEYQRLSAKHGALITRYGPIITQSTVAGSPRYNLNLGPMASNDVASSVCNSLISAGERDCAVHRQ